MSPSDKQLWKFLKKFLVAETSQCKALLIGCHLEISLLLLMSAKKHRNTNFCIFEALFLVRCSSAICGVLSLNSQVQVRIRADEERTEAHTLFNYNRVKAGFVYAEVYAFKGTS